MAKYRIVRGIHIEAGVVYKSGENNILESASDLTRFNLPESFRFEKLTENTPTSIVSDPSSATTNDDGLETMSEAELRKFAESEKIQLPKGAKKEDVIKAIRAVMSPVAA
jgi:hypothetical protein